MKAINNNIKKITGLYFLKGKVVKILSQYNSFKKLTSLQTILEEIEKDYGEEYVKEKGLNTTLKLNRFLKNNGISVFQVIACFENNALSKAIMHYPHTFDYKGTMAKIRSYLGDVNEYDNDNFYKNELSAFIGESKKVRKNTKKEMLDKFDAIYEKINGENTKEEMKNEINYINQLKEKIINKFGFELEIDEKKEINEKWYDFLKNKIKGLDEYIRKYNIVKDKPSIIDNELSHEQKILRDLIYSNLNLKF